MWLPIFLALVLVAQGVLIFLYVRLYPNAAPSTNIVQAWIKTQSMKNALQAQSETILEKSAILQKPPAKLHAHPKLQVPLSEIAGIPLKTNTVFVDEDDQPVLFIAIFSGQNFDERRNSIRQTWMKECTIDRNVVCRFFTDILDTHAKPIRNDTLLKLKKESKENHDDLVLTETPSGSNFAIRLLESMEWAKENFAFDYFLRIDDDHFLCIDRLLRELPYRPRKGLYWGHLHCLPGNLKPITNHLYNNNLLIARCSKTKSIMIF